MKTRVALVGCSSYDTEAVYRSVVKAVELSAGRLDFAKPGSRILVKPNLLTACVPEKGVTTHPAVVEAVVRLLKDCGSRVVIGDSPGIESVKHMANYERVLKMSGLREVADRYGVECVRFRDPVTLPKKQGHRYKEIQVAREALEVDAIVNVPKFKTHVQMYLTLCVKNMFGCVVGAQKPQWHFRAGSDYRHFARMLVEIYDFLKPAFNVLDGVSAMEGNGPSAGTMRPLGVILAGADGVAVDRVGCELVAGNPESFFTLEEARQLGCGQADLSGIEVTGDPIARHALRDFKFSETMSMSDMGPAFLQKYLRAWVTARPAQHAGRCVLCGACQEACPGKAITREGKRLRFDYRKCINCFCCAELCSYDAIKICQPFLARLLKGKGRAHGR